MTLDPDHARRLIRQHAETAALLGADAVPVSNRFARGVDAPTTAKPSARVSTDGPKHERLAKLRARYEAQAPHAPFISDFTNLVFHDGDPDARLMFIGEAPGADEDKQGVPFVGRAGQLLNKMITAMGLSRETVYIANVLKVRPPNNATPTPDEIAASKPFLLEQIQIVRPEVIVALGLPAAKCVLGVNDSMGNLRAQFHDIELPDGSLIPVMPTYHPAYLLRAYTAENRGKVWADLQMVIDRLGLASKA